VNPKLIVREVSPRYWRATIDNPPINMFDPDLRNELRDLIGRIEADDQLQVIVFDSADPEYFIAHVDLARAGEVDPVPGPTGLSAWPDFTVRLAHAPVLSVASVRGRARGIGNEFVLATDVRFASRERARFGQFEVGAAAIPGGGGIERLFRLVGRARTLEAVVGADDVDADTAERYGWINRAVPDAELDQFVDRFARRVASFDREAVVTAKRLVNEQGGIPAPDELIRSSQAFGELLQRPLARQRIGELIGRGLQTRGELELTLGDRVGPQ
jgi:enoyl-CoA hydratase/carnithine racemase